MSVRIECSIEFADDITDPHQRARANRLEGNIRYTIGEVDGTVGLLLDAAKTYAPFDIRAARETLLDALTAARIPAALSLPGERMSDVASVARECPLPSDMTPTIGDLLLDGYVAIVEGDPETGQLRLSEALDALETDHRDDEPMLRWLAMGCWAAGALGDDETLRRITSRLDTAARAHGAIVPLALALTFRALNELGTESSLRRGRTSSNVTSSVTSSAGRETSAGFSPWRGMATKRARAARRPRSQPPPTSVATAGCSSSSTKPWSYSNSDSATMRPRCRAPAPASATIRSSRPLTSPI